MNDDDRNGQLPVTEADTTPPNPVNAVPPPDSGWQMPEPKFQQSSGYLPQGYLDQVNVGGGGPAVAVAAAPSPEPVVQPDVEPQPDLSEQLDTEPMAAAVPATPVKERSTGARVAMVVFGILGMIAFIAVFLGVVYYLFLAPGGEGSPF